MYAPEVFTFDPDDINIIIGVVELKSYGPDGVTLARSTNHTEKEVGVKGDASISRQRDKTGTLSINLISQSDHDKMFDELQAITDLYTFPVVLEIKSMNKQLATIGWYETMPDLTAGASAGSRTHVIGLQNAIPSALEAAFNLAGTVKNAIA
ncbi:hypothetical protein NVP1084O_161 [Vibrio phage 1.084.O._10N.261.49.F5]|nr:hypothetical protein NVP1084O_161 [Vibrio phage 1.084.O._10N.261.49.F5]